MTTPAIRFLDLTHADLGGGKSVRKPFVIGELTAKGYRQLKSIPHPWPTEKAKIVAELAQFERERFGFIRHTDELGEEDEDFYYADHDLSKPQEKVRTPGWHPDARHDDQNHMYIVGSADERMNTEYALGRLRQTRNFLDKVYDRIEKQPPDDPLQQQITRALELSGGIARVGPRQVVLMPVRTWHRSSPRHLERTDPWPFLRLTLHRRALGGDMSR